MTDYKKMARMTEGTHDRLKILAAIQKKDMGEILKGAIKLYDDRESMISSLKYTIKTYEGYLEIVHEKLMRETDGGRKVPLRTAAPYEEEYTWMNDLIDEIKTVVEWLEDEDYEAYE